MHDLPYDLDQFAKVFVANINSRSRSAKGSSDISSSVMKRTLLKSNEGLRRQVEENTLALVQSVWFLADVTEPRTPRSIGQLMETWFDIINKDLVDLDEYAEERARLQTSAEKMRAETGLPYRINRRYRVWKLKYTSLDLSPVELEIRMDAFYLDLYNMIDRARKGLVSQAEILAYADYMIDTAIHPWSDGCGRCATALVMWLNLVVPYPKLPVFGSREEHLRAILDPAEHTRYFELCLGR